MELIPKFLFKDFCKNSNVDAVKLWRNFLKFFRVLLYDNLEMKFLSILIVKRFSSSSSYVLIGWMVGWFYSMPTLIQLFNAKVSSW